MKSCPTCNRTFEDTFTFCLADGSLLDAPFDAQATLAIPEPRQTEPPPTAVLRSQEIRQEIPPTVASPEPTQPHREVVTVASTATEFETVDAPPRIKDHLAQPVRKSHRLSLTIGALATLLIIGVAFFILRNRTDSARQSPLNENAAPVNTAAPDSANATNSASSGAASDKENTSSKQSTITTESVGGEPLPSPSRSSTKKAQSVPSPSVNSGRKDTAIVAKPARPDINASATPCANKSRPVCEPNERLGCNAATGLWECRRSRK
ncbi:MAG: hypothetical protein QOH25_204 [Acidobacteriota bacterium]|nr:hypothetical protein [Acidobacteriota bacterium]